MDTAHWVFTAAIALGACALSFGALKHYRGKGHYLCNDCKFNDPKDCLKEERPYAMQCTSYRIKD